jgi:hypothetical protein
MANTLNASTSAGLVQTADTSGSIDLQSAGATKLTVSSSGTSIAQYNPAASLITSGTAVASTSGTSITFSSIPSWAKRITVMFNGVSTNGSSDLLVRLGTSGGVVSTGYLGASTLTSTGVSTTNYTTGFGINQASAGTGYLGNGVMTICLLSSSSNTWAQSGNFSQPDFARACYTSGSVALSGVATTVTITTVNGTDAFDAGTINILYE